MSLDPTRPVRMAVDIGGTFTDFQIFDARDGLVRTWKVATTPDNPARGLFTGAREAAARFGFALADVGLLMHGTTIATNAVLERKLARGVLLTTAGFEDVLEINRHVRRNAYELLPDPPPTLIPRDRRFGVPERIRFDGAVERALDIDALDDLLSRIDAAGAEAVAICLLNAHVEPRHERELAEWLRARRPGLPVSLSCEISPEIREYERTSTVVLNALLLPVVATYLGRLRGLLGRDGFSPRVLLVQSNGGACSLETAAAQPARLLLSGPSGGVLAAERFAALLDRPNLVAVDMGGTSFDVSVVQDGRVGVVSQGEVDRLPIRLAMVEIRTIGAGGGSIATVEAGQRLTVGPRSAGAEPGPVAYGKGGAEATVTDANLVLGRLNERLFLGGRMVLHPAEARAAVTRRIADPLGMTEEAAADGIVRVANAAFGGAVRLALFEKGLDPRAFSLFSFGGAGGLHALDIAAEVGIDEVVIPPEPGTLSAFGILFSDIAHHLVRSQTLCADDESLPTIAASIAGLRQEAALRLDADGVPLDDRILSWAADLRYLGQAFELMVPWGDPEPVDGASLQRLVAGFHVLHRQRFHYANADDLVECVAIRLVARGRLPKPEPGQRESARDGGEPDTRRVFADGAWVEVPVFRRDDLPSGGITGPAVIEEAFATHWVPHGWIIRAERHGVLLARRNG